MKPESMVLLDLNNPQFQDELFALQKLERHSAIETFKKIRRMTWDQIYRDRGLKWERIASIAPPPGVSALYSLRLTQSLRCLCYREGNALRAVSIPPDHDSTYGKK